MVVQNEKNNPYDSSDETDHYCGWPTMNLKGVQKFCPKPKEKGLSYCEVHEKANYNRFFIFFTIC